MAKASVEKKHLQVGASGTVGPGVSQVTLFDEAQLQPVTLGPGWIYLHVAGDPAVGNTGVVEIVALVLDASQAIPTLTAAVKDELEEQLWWQTSITYGAGGAGSGLLLIKTQRAFRTGERLVIEAVTESFAAAPTSRSVTTRGQVMRIQA